ncbi:MAG TPA: YciI family protein, partial [Gemmatimonadales bacterium]
HFSGSKRSVTDGPFAETKELVAGYWVWQVRSMEEAVEWAKRCPNPMPGPSDVEIRPFWEPEDFDPEVVAQVNAHREKIANGGK